MTTAERLAEYRRKTDPNSEILKRIQILKGDKGDQGPIGPAGADGKHGQSIIGPRGIKGDQGPKGDRGPAGRDGENGKDGKAGKDALPLQSQPIIDTVLKELSTGSALEPKHVKGLGEKIKNLDELIAFLKAGGFRGGGGGTSTTVQTSGAAPTLSINPPTTGLVNSSNITYTYKGQVSLVVVDSKIDVDAQISFTSGITTITTSTPPQNNMYVISGNYLTQQVPTDAINSSNISYMCSFPVYLTIVDNSIDQDAIQSFNPTLGKTTVTTSTPPQNNVLLIGGGGMNPQVPIGTKNSSNSSFTAVGLVTVAVIESSIDVNATLIYSAITNGTIIKYSIPPKSTDEIYAF